MTHKLLPCPFCGSQPYFSQPVVGSEWFEVSCNGDECGAMGPSFKSKDEAAAVWNRRTPPPESHTDWQAVAEHYRLAMLEVERRISSQPVREMLPGQSINETAKFISDLSQVLWEARQKVIFKEPLAAPAPETKAMQISAADDPDRPWEPWTVMHVGDQRNIIREVLSEDGQTALAYFTGKFMALAPISENPEPLPFKVWRQRRIPSPQPREVG